VEYYEKFGDYKYILDKIKNLFFIEEYFKIKRLNFEEINNIDIIKTKTFLLENIEKLYIVYKNNESKNKTIKSIKYKIDIIKNENYLHKFIAECYNKVIEEVINIYSQQYRTEKTINRKYIFKITF
jgi:hypothetical protein